MFQMNQVRLTGNITKPAETHPAGDARVTRARLIHNMKLPKSDGGTVEKLAAVDLEIWGKRGEAFAQHITTKTPVYVEGYLLLDQWEQQGEKRSRLLVRVTDWQFLLPRSEQSGASQRRDAA